MFWIGYKETEVKAMLCIASGLSTSLELREANRGVYNGVLSLVKKGDVIKEGDTFILRQELLEQLNLGKKAPITTDYKDSCLEWIKKIDKKLDKIMGETTVSVNLATEKKEAISGNKFLTEKQKILGNSQIDIILGNVSYEGFNGETYDFNNLCTWIQGDLRDYIKEGVINGLKKNSDIDFTMFKI